MAEQNRKRRKLKEKGQRASAVFRKKRNIKTEALEKHQTALRRAKTLLLKHQWGSLCEDFPAVADQDLSSKVFSTTGGIASSSSSSSSFSSSSSSSSSSTSTSTSATSSLLPASPRSIQSDDYQFLQRALYSFDLSDLTVQKSLSHIGGTSCTNLPYQHALDTLTSTVRVLEWEKDMNKSRMSRLTEWTNLFNATGRTLHVLTNGRLSRYVSLLKSVEHSLRKKENQNQMKTNASNQNDTEIDWLVNELMEVLTLTEQQKDEIMSMKDTTCREEISIGLMGKSFKTIRVASTNMSNLHHKVHTALTNLLQEDQLEIFLKQVHKVREQKTNRNSSDPQQTSKFSEFHAAVNPLGNDTAGLRMEYETLTDYLRRLLSKHNHGERETRDHDESGVSTGGHASKAMKSTTLKDAAGSRRRAERVLANANVVGIDSESAMSATEDFVQRRDSLLKVLVAHE